MLLITPNKKLNSHSCHLQQNVIVTLSVAPPPSPQDCTSSLLGPSLPPAPPQTSVAPALLRPSESPPTPRSPKPPALPWRSRSSTSLRLIGFPSPPCAPPLPAPSVGPMEPSALHPPWLLPPSAPPWAAMNPPGFIQVPPGPSLAPSSIWLLSACLPASPLPSPVTIPSPLLVFSS